MQLRWIYSLALMIVSVLLAKAGDLDVNSAGVYTKVLGKSGKIMVGTQQNVASDPNRITVEMDSLKELDNLQQEVCTKGNQKHSFNTFATQDFTFSPVTEDTFQNISVKQFTFNTTLKSLSSRVTVLVYIFLESGTINLASEELKVKAGNVKFSIQLDDWIFCDIKTEIGAFVDFTISIKGKNNPSNTSSNDDSVAYLLGGGTSFKLSRKVSIDSVIEDMPTGFPKVVTQGSKTSIIFRFKKFTQTALYDPTIEVGGEDPAGDSASTYSACVLTLIFATIMSLFNNL